MSRIASISFLFTLLVYAGKALAFPPVEVDHVRCEMLTNPLGIGTANPRFSWQLQSEERAVMQTNYQVLVASSLEKLSKNEGDLWSSGKVHSDKSILLSYSGKPLSSRQTCFWKVKVWTNKGETDWSTPASFTIGLLNA